MILSEYFEGNFISKDLELICLLASIAIDST